MTDSTPVLTQTKAGHKVKHRGIRSYEVKEITVDREWTVTLDGVVIGRITYSMITRERKTPGRRYVNSRWESPGWRAYLPSAGAYGYGRESYSRADAVRHLVFLHGIGAS